MVHIHRLVINSVNQWDWWLYQVINLQGHLIIREITDEANCNLPYAKQYPCMILEWGACQQNLFLGFSGKTRQNTVQQACFELFKHARKDAFYLPCITTRDEFCIYDYDFETKQMFYHGRHEHDLSWKQVKCGQKSRQPRLPSLMWSIWCIPDFFFKNRTLMWLFTEPFCNAMEMAFHWKQYHKWSSSARLLHRDTGSCHTEFLAKHRMPVVLHLLYLLDFAPMQILMLPQAIACP